MTTRCVASWPPATCVWGKCRASPAGHVSPLELNNELSLSYHSIGLHRGLAGDYAGALESYRKFLG